MSQLLVTVIVGGAALAALPLLARSIGQARAAGDFDASTALTFGMGWLVTLPIALVAITGGVSRRPDVFGDLFAIFPAWYLDATRAAMVLLAVLAAVLLVRRLRSQPVVIHVAALVAMLLWAVAHLAAGLQGDPLLTLGGVALLVCLMAASVLPRGRGASLGAGLFGVTLGIASGLLAVFHYDVAFIPCQPNECSVLGHTFVGVLPNQDLLGITFAAAIPFSYLGFRGPARIWFVFYLAGLAIATGSRTATIASLITIAALLIVRPRLDAARAVSGRTAIAGLVLVAAVLGSLYVTQHDWQPTDLTGRPVVWKVAEKYVHDSPWLGYGSERWSSLDDSSVIPHAAERSTHNQWLDVLFVAGWVGVALLVLLLVVTVLSAGYARSAVVVMLATMAMIGSTEGLWSIGTLDWLSFSLVALILTGPTGERSEATASARLSARLRFHVGQSPGLLHDPG